MEECVQNLHMSHPFAEILEMAVNCISNGVVVGIGVMIG